MEDIYGAGVKAKIVTRGAHMVSKGDTLYSIAWRYGWDFRELARVNNVARPYTIYPGQTIRFSATKKTVAASQSARVIASAPAKKKKPVKTAAKPVAVASSVTSLNWQWPGRGKILSGFSAVGAGRQGILLGGKSGDPVRAAEKGVVVYRGDGLTGYGNLLIVKHDERWLSAYAHNQRLLVKEGDAVAAGQKIATLGDTGTFRNQLHFEIRRNGTPVDPIKYLPGR